MGLFILPRTNAAAHRHPQRTCLAALAGDGVEALGQILDELQRVGRARRLTDLLHGSIGPPVGDVLGNGTVE